MQQHSTTSSSPGLKQQQQQQPSAQRLAHPTAFHLQQTLIRQLRVKALAESAGNPFAGTIDPQLLHQFQQQQQQQQNTGNSQQNAIPIKGHSSKLNSSSGDMDYETSTGAGGVGSPISTPLGSPMNHQWEGTDDYAIAQLVHSGATSPYGQSPADATLYSPGSDTHDFFMDSVEAGGSSSVGTSVGPMDVKISGGSRAAAAALAGSFGAHPMSMPVRPSGTWFGSFDQNSLPGSHPNSFQMQAGLDMANAFEGMDEAEIQKQQLLYEKRRRRRETHNAVERRRRDNINEKIQELSSLLPETMIDGSQKPNKGLILRRSVDYIRILQHQLNQQAVRNQELESRLRQYQDQYGEEARKGQS
ncbi:uncharacterized protein VTP21DRAFT_10348 [Calcarisporiella thermophila]|uniref:uncharacterized protein n=1 Tax=Calcarisporiella thermophila TaxID=911321 RepID=UPI003743C5DF